MSGMSYYHKPRPNPLVNRRFFEFLDEHATKTPDKDLMVFYDDEGKRSSLTFKKFYDQTRLLASGLIEQGLGRGDKVLICAPNCFEFAISWLAVNRIGACAVLQYSGTLTERCENLLKQLKCEGIVCGLNVNSSHERSRVLQVLAKLVEMRDSNGARYLRSVVLIGGDEKTTSEIQHDNISTYKDLLIKGAQVVDKLNDVERKVQCEDYCFSLLSSGTTGQYKAVSYTHHGLVNAINLDVAGGYEEDSVTFSGWPMAWGSEAPCFAAAVVIGFTFVTAPFSKITPQDSYHFMLKIIQDEKCDDFHIPQQDIPKMIAENFQEKYDLSSVEGFGYGGQIVPRKCIRSLLNIFPTKYAVLVYASVELLTVAIQPLNKESINSECYGRMFILPDIEVKVVDENGLVVPLGEKGLICARGAKTFGGYLGNPTATSEVKTKTGWVNTRDYGIMYEGGKLKVLGREMDIIHRGSEKLFPCEFEDILMEHQDITDAVFVGVPDKILKQELCACVIQVPGSDLKSRGSELEDWCMERFTVSKGEGMAPKYFVFLDEFPLVENSKIDRRAIQKLALEKLSLK